MFTKRPIDLLTDNNAERLKVNSIEQLLYNRIFEMNHQNANFDDLPFDGDDGFIL